ncbi:MAG: electron transfer flavoprotein subunit beta/FixA family protein [Bacteroidales bacterium]|jgi:electron transfer flavoprotein beta subunit
MVPDTTQVSINPETNTLIREGVPFITNPFDTNAVEEAIRFKDKYGAYVTVISMGPPSAEKVLKKAISIGADEAILLSDRVFGGADTLATSMVLSFAIKKINETRPADIIFCGKQTIDGDTAQVGPGIAQRLDISQLTLVNEILDVDLERKRIKVKRKLENYIEIVETSMPVMLTVEREINMPRYPTVPCRLEAESYCVKLWSNDILKLDVKEIGLSGSPTQVRRIFAPVREKGETITGEGEQKHKAADFMFNKLIEKNIITT